MFRTKCKIISMFPISGERSKRRPSGPLSRVRPDCLAVSAKSLSRFQFEYVAAGC